MKRNNRNILAVKISGNAGGSAWLAKKQGERDEIKLERAANNISLIIYISITEYNTIARGNDKVW